MKCFPVEKSLTDQNLEGYWEIRGRREELGRYVHEKEVTRAVDSVLLRNIHTKYIKYASWNAMLEQPSGHHCIIQSENEVKC